MTSTRKRTLVAVLLGFAAAFAISILNGFTFALALYSAALLAVIAGVIVGVLSWAIEYAVGKGYPGWLGPVLVIFLNIVGVIILVLLPTRRVG